MLTAILWTTPLTAAVPPQDVKKESYQKRVDSQLKDLSARVDDLQARAEKAGASARAKVDRDIAILREKINEARKKLEDLKLSTEDKWESIRNSLDKTVKDADHRYQKTVKKEKL